MAEVKIEYINPFISAATEAMKTMVFTECERVGLYVKKEKDVRHILSEILLPGDMVLTQGAGSVGGLSRLLASKGFMDR